jgi:hypothetical protein
MLKAPMLFFVLLRALRAPASGAMSHDGMSAALVRQLSKKPAAFA